MNIIPLTATDTNYGAALVVAAVVIGLTTRLAVLFRQRKRFFPHS